MQGNGYGVEYQGRGTPYGTGYRPGSQGNFGTGYDFGYQGGEWGYPVNARGFGTRGSYRTPESGLGRGRGSGSGEWRGREYNAADGRDYAFGGARDGAPWGFRRGRGTEYGADFREVDASRVRRGHEPAPGRPADSFGSADFGEHADRHYGRTPVDRWPAGEAARSGARLDDDEVRESVRENLFQDSFVDPERIEVAVERGVVTLRGDVDDFLQARYAWDDAWESPGVRGVINNLTVRTDRASDELDLPQTSHRRGAGR